MMNGKIWCVAGAAMLLWMNANASAKLDDSAIRKQNQFQEYVLAAGEVYKIYVKKDNGVTTVTFPSAISKIAGVNVSQDDTRDFQISAKPGSYYFNLVALKDGAEGTLTVVYNRKTYVLYLINDNDKAYSSVNFAGGTGGESSRHGSGSAVSPARLLSLIDIVKTFDLIQQKYPSELRDAARKANHRMFSFGAFRMELLEVVRFNREDTLVFKLLMHNDSDQEILYDKFSFSVQVGGKTYYMSAADASGSMPPKSASWAFFTITGTPEGGRANLAPDNEFLLGVTTRDMENRLDVPVLPKEPDEIVFPVVSEEPSLKRRVDKLDEDINGRLAKLVADMENVIHRIEAGEVKNREEAGLHTEKTAQEVEREKRRDIEVLSPVSETENEASAEESEISFWDFTQFPGNLLVPVKALKFWGRDDVSEVSGSDVDGKTHEDEVVKDAESERSPEDSPGFLNRLLAPVMWLKFW